MRVRVERVKQEQHMADNTEITPDSEARKWFTIAIEPKATRNSGIALLRE